MEAAPHMYVSDATDQRAVYPKFAKGIFRIYLKGVGAGRYNFSLLRTREGSLRPGT